MAVAGDIADVVDRCPGVFGVYARNLTTRELVDIDADRVLPTESAAKTFILVHYAALVAAGACDPTSRVELKDEHRLLGTGVLRYLASGLSLTLDDLAWLMIVVSDNAATAMLMGTVATPDEVNATMARLGLPTARMNPDITLEKAMAGEPFATSTPRDLAETYTHLDERCRRMLFRQQHLIGLPRRLPHAADAPISASIYRFGSTTRPATALGVASTPGSSRPMTPPGWSPRWHQNRPTSPTAPTTSRRRRSPRSGNCSTTRGATRLRSGSLAAGGSHPPGQVRAAPGRRPSHFDKRCDIALRRIEVGELITTDARKETDRELTTFLSAYETAVDTYDVKKLEGLINAEAVAWVERRGETGRAGIIGALRGDGAEPLRLTVRDPHWIIGTGRWEAVCSYDFEIGGSPSTARSTGHVTDVLKVIDGNWQIIYRHESRA